MTIQLRLKNSYSPYKIAKELGRASNTIRNEIARGTVTQMIQVHKVDLYLADVGENIYLQHRQHCCPKYKRLSCNDFISYICATMQSKKWSVYACVEYAVLNQLFKTRKWFVLKPSIIILI